MPTCLELSNIYDETFFDNSTIKKIKNLKIFFPSYKDMSKVTKTKSCSKLTQETLDDNNILLLLLLTNCNIFYCAL